MYFELAPQFILRGFPARRHKNWDSVKKKRRENFWECHQNSVIPQATFCLFLEVFLKIAR